MNINNNILPCSKNLQYNKNQPKPSLEFKGLTQDFERKIYPSYENLVALCQIKNCDTVGVVPLDIIKKIQETNSRADVEKHIKNIMQSYKLAAQTLREGEEIIEQNLDRIINANLIKSKNKIYEDFGSTRYNAYLNEYFSIGSIDRKKLRKLEKQAATTLEKALKEANVIPQNGKILINYIGCGNFGYTFNISHLDSSGNKLFHDKVIKLYKNYKMFNKILDMVIKKEDQMQEEAEFERFYSNLINSFAKLNKFSKEEKKKLRKNALEIFTKNKNRLKAYQSEYFEQRRPALDLHGCFAEANRAMFIKNKIKNIKQTNYIEAHFFDLKDGFGIFETADEELSPIKQKVELSKFNLRHADGSNPENLVLGRIVDYGGIFSLDCLGDIL